MSAKKWTEVCHSNEEKLFFVGLSLNPEKPWRSADGLAQELGWPIEKVNALLDRFAQQGIILQHPTNPKLWGYWERVQTSPQ